MSDVTDLFARALADTQQVVELVKPDQWSNDTPCTEWDVRALTKHLVYELLWMPPMLEGKTIEQVGDAYEGDILADDPMGAFRRAGQQAESAVREPGAMEKIVHLSFGDHPGEEYTRQVLFDLVIHGWDLRKAIGADPALQLELVRGVRDWWDGWRAGYEAAGAIASGVTVPEGADEQDVLIASTGRSPTWPD